MATIPPNAFPVYTPRDHGGNQLYTNPLGDLLAAGNYTSNGRTSTVTVSLTEQLDFITRGLSASGASFNNFFRSYTYKDREYERWEVSKDASGNPVYTVIGQNTALDINQSRSNQWRNFGVQAFLNYNRSFGSHAFDGVMMYNADEYVVTGSDLAFKHAGLAGRLTYVNNDKYIGEFSFGYNGTENFPRGKRYGFFPAGSLGWILSNENFLSGAVLLIT